MGFNQSKHVFCFAFSLVRLVDEVKTLAEQVSSLQGRLREAEEALVRLYTARGQLEREIQIKRNSLYIDKDRCQVTRSHYPSSTALAGYA